MSIGKKEALEIVKEIDTKQAEGLISRLDAMSTMVGEIYNREPYPPTNPVTKKAIEHYHSFNEELEEKYKEFVRGLVKAIETA